MFWVHLISCAYFLFIWTISINLEIWSYYESKRQDYNVLRDEVWEIGVENTRRHIQNILIVIRNVLGWRSLLKPECFSFSASSVNAKWLKKVPVFSTCLLKCGMRQTSRVTDFCHYRGKVPLMWPLVFVRKNVIWCFVTRPLVKWHIPHQFIGTLIVLCIMQ